MMKRSAVLLYLPVWLLMASSLWAAEFDEGVIAFKAGDYPKALLQFQLAQESGRNDDSLWYNLGSTWYRLQFYKNAHRAFSAIPETSRLWQVSRYNLGLIALKQHKYRSAQYYFEQALAGQQEGISYLAETQLTRLNTQLKQDQKSVAKAKARAWQGFVQASYGYDDNVNFAPLDLSTQQGEQFVDVFASARWYVAGSKHAQGWALNTRAAARDYFNGSLFDYSDIYGGAQYHFRLGDIGRWKGRVAMDLGKSNYGGAAYQSLLEGRGQMDYLLAGHKRLRFAYRYEAINSDDSRFDYLQGHRQRLKTAFLGSSETHYWSVSYRLELNDRDEIRNTQNGIRASYSPTRNELYARYARYLSARWQLGARLSLSQSDYPAADIGTRQDRRLRGIAETSWRTAKHSKLRMTYEYTDNRSSLERLYSYRRAMLSLSFSQSF